MKCFKSENRDEIIMLIKILCAAAIYLSTYKSKLKCWVHGKTIKPCQ